MPWVRLTLLLATCGSVAWLNGCGTVEVVGDLDCGDDAEPVVNLEMHCETVETGLGPGEAHPADTR